MFPIGYPLPGVKVPDFGRKPLDQIMVTVTEPHNNDPHNTTRDERDDDE